MHLLFYIKFILQETVMPLRRKTTGSWFCNYQKQICLVGSVCSKDRRPREPALGRQQDNLTVAHIL